MSGTKILPVFIVLVSLLVARDPASSFSNTENEKLSSAKSFENVFQKISETQLLTTEDSPIAHISDMEIDREGRFIIADGWQSRAVYVFGPDGRFIKELGRKGQGPGEYLNPVSIEIGKKEEIWVSDYGNNRVNIYSKELSFKSQISFTSRVLHYLHLNSRNEIYMYRSTANPLKPDTSDTIFRYDAQGNKIASFAPFPKEALKVKFWAAQDGMTIGKDDFIYEMNPLYYNVRKFSPEGELTVSFSRKTRLFQVITEKGKTPIIVYGPYYLQRGLIIAHVNEHLEIYDSDGRFIVGELPFSEKIIGVRGNRLYTEVWEDEGKSEVLLNPKIICYQLRSLLF